MSQVRFATSNMFKNLNAEESLKHVNKVIDEADIIVWQEVTRVHRKTLRALGDKGWATFFPETPGGLAISWRTNRFMVSRAGIGRRVIPGIKAVDPARGFADIILEDIEDGTIWPVLDTHMTHQAWTSHPERRPRWWALAYRLRRRSARLRRRHGRMLGGGDVNRHRWAPKGTTGAWPPGGTHGRSNYDVLWRKGKVAMIRVPHEVRTPSDHDTPVATFQST